VLLVDDEAGLRDFVSEGLQSLGYRVQCCPDGKLFERRSWVQRHLQRD